MEQVKHVNQEPVAEAEYQDVEQAEQEEQMENPVAAEIHIQVLKDGNLKIGTPEGYPELQPMDLENITRQVSQQLHDMRIATMTFDMLKQRLG